MRSHALRAAAGNAGGSGISLTYDQITSANSTSITVPASADVGDLAILIDTPLTTSTLVIPSGWTSAYEYFLSGPFSSRTYYAVFSYKS